MVDELMTWYDTERRPLPWRDRRTPYGTLVSEVMLQQTQVATVIPYYARWIERFPNPTVLADARLDDALKLWEGLGYYRRAHRLHAAAVVVRDRYGGALPSETTELRTLPGVGRYTAAAIASMAFGVRAVAVDTNVARIAARLTADPTAGVGAAERALAPLQPEDRPGDFNEALMDLGASVCGAREPRCDGCPIRGDCLAHRRGIVDRIPAQKAQRTRPSRHRYAHVGLRDGRVALRRRAADEMLAGLWGFVQTEHAPDGTDLLAPIRHRYTHLDLTVTPAVGTGLPPGATWIARSELGDLALSGVDHKVLDALPKGLGATDREEPT